MSTWHSWRDRCQGSRNSDQKSSLETQLRLLRMVFVNMALDELSSTESEGGWKPASKMASWYSRPCAVSPMMSGADLRNQQEVSETPMCGFQAWASRLPSHSPSTHLRWGKPIITSCGTQAALWWGTEDSLPLTASITCQEETIQP